MIGDPLFNNIEDNLNTVLQEFLGRRQVQLNHRFPGWYRAVVKETNDPLQFRRVRVLIPELHNSDSKTEDLPWALPAPWMGGVNTGSWTHPIINDIVFVCFEKQHPYVPIYCSAADPTRRRMYTLWSIYTKSPQAVDEQGNPADVPQDFQDDYLPKDGRPLSTGFSDRYGNYLNLSSFGFIPKSHRVAPASVGTDALTKSDYNTNKNQPLENDPDLKYFIWGTKYGHTAIFGDQGYKWSSEFKGDFEEDSGFEEKRYKYLQKYYNEQESKERDQRRIEFRTRSGMKFEMRDVGWDKSRSGEYGDVTEIGNSQGRDERWIKLRTKGGHLIEALDKGFNPESDNFYKRLNKSEFGVMPDKEDELGDDSRMIRLITRHGNQLILDDRGTSSVSAEDETPHGNGVMLRTRKGFQMQMCDKPDLDHFMVSTPKAQCIEINDESEYIIISTSQSGKLSEKIENNELKSKPKWINKKGLTNDPEANTQHLKMDKINAYVRLKNSDGAGMEIRGGKAPCGQWTETRDSENRAVWMSKTDQHLIIRNKTGEIFIIMDDKDDAIMIRNEKDRIVIHAKKDISFRSDEGNICFEAPSGEIGFKTKKIAIGTGGAQHIIDNQGIGTTRTVAAAELKGIHKELAPGMGGGSDANRGEAPCKFQRKEVKRKKPDDFDKERGCDPFKSTRGAVPESTTSGGIGGGPGGPDSGGFGGAINLPNSDPPPPSTTIPPPPTGDGPPTPVLSPDPIEEVNPGSGGVLWYGVSKKFLGEIKEKGLLLESFSNYLNVFPKTDATEILLSKTLEYAEGKDQAILSQQRYGSTAVILRIRNVPEPNLLRSVVGNNNVVSYLGELSFDGNIEIFDVGTKEFSQPPLFPNI